MSLMLLVRGVGVLLVLVLSDAARGGARAAG